MPYIKNSEREAYEDIFDSSPINSKTSAGNLNYVLTKLIVQYIGANPEYQRFCEVEGVLGHVSQELYRRRVVGYENKKMMESDDVYATRY